MADDMGYGDTECYNPESLTPTPHIDRLAREGARFTYAHSGCAVCTPTRYGLMTGRAQWRTSKKHSLVMPYDPPLIPPERMTMGGLFQSCGYTTACVGKWHLGLHYREKEKAGYRRHFTIIEEDIDFAKPVEGGPVDLGFDYFFGTAGCSTSDAPYCYFRNKQSVGIPTIPTPPEMNKEPGVYPGLMTDDWDQLAVDTTFLEEAVGFIDAQAESDKPFFLYYPLSAPHIPWLTPEFIRGSSGDGPRGDMNALVDWCVGQVYAKLEAHGLLENTLLIFTSDNGPQRGVNGHDATAGLRGLKNTPYEGGHRVPFIVRWPGKVAEGVVRETRFSLTDMMATFAEGLGVSLPDCVAEDSVSVWGAFVEGDSAVTEHPLVAHTGWHVCEEGHYSLQEGAWKLIEFNPNPDQKIDRQCYELYNLQDDPHETTDRTADQPDILQQMQERLNELRSGPGLRFNG